MNRAESYYSSDHSLYYNHYRIMGTRFDVIIHGMEKEGAENAFVQMTGELARLDKIMNRFDPYSQVSMVNKMAGLKPVKLEKELFGILLECQQYHKNTSGLFDISLGKTGDLVKSGRSDKHMDLPGGLIENAGMENIIFDPGDYTIYFTKPGISIDLGGFGKGYSLDCIKNIIVSMNISNAFISFGDSSIIALGNHPHGQGWKAGIKHLYKPQESVYSFDLHNESLSTSGSNHFRGNAMGSGHIIHPLRGAVENMTRQISVKSPSATDSEVLSTALLCADDQENKNILHKFPDCRAIMIDYDDKGVAFVKELNQ